MCVDSWHHHTHSCRACCGVQAEGSASERTRTTITAGLKKKLKDLMAEFSELRTRMNEEYREVVERRMFTVSGEGGGKQGGGGSLGWW